MQNIHKEINLSKNDLPIIEICYFNLTSIVGIILMIFGLIYFFINFREVQISSFYNFNNSIQTQGVIVSKSDAKASENQVEKIAYDYTYKVNQKEYLGTAFSINNTFEIGDNASVIYLNNKPQISNIVGMDTKPMSWIAHIGILIFVILGVALIISGYIWGKKFIKSLLGNILTDATFIHYKMIQGSDYPTYINYYKFFDQQGNIFFTFDSNASSIGYKNLKVLYEKNNPEENQIINFNNSNLVFSKRKLKRILFYNDY